MQTKTQTHKKLHTNGVQALFVVLGLLSAIIVCVPGSVKQTLVQLKMYCRIRSVSC